MPSSPARLICHLRRALPPGPCLAPDADLLARFARGRDDSAFTALVSRHGEMVWRVCRRALGDDHDAEDACQAVFLVLARKAGSLRRPQALAGWLHGVAYRVALRARRDRARRAGPTQPLPLGPVDPRPGPLDELSAREEMSLIDDEVQRLPEGQRLPVVLCCLAGRTQDEAACELGWAPGAVKGRLERGRKRLHERLAQRGLALPAVLLALEAARGVAPASAARLLAEHAARPSSGARALAEAALRGMAWARRKAAAALLLLGALTAGAAVALRPALTKLPPSGGVPGAAGPPAVARAPGKDQQGDPLPPGALARMGTARLRHGDAIVALAVSPDGKSLVSQSYDRTVRVWDLATGKERHRYPAPRHGGVHGKLYGAVGFSARSEALQVESADRTVLLRDVATGKVLREFRGHRERVDALFLAPGGKWLASAALGADKTIRIWEAATGKQLGKVPNHKHGARFAAFSPDGKVLATVSIDDPIRLWDVPSGKLLREVQGADARIVSLAFAPDGKVLASGDDQNIVRLWQVRTGKELGRVAVRAVSLAFAPNSKVLASGSMDGSVRLWDTGPKELRKLDGHGGWASALAFAPDGKVLVSAGGGDHSGGVPRVEYQVGSTIRLWNASTGEELPQSRGLHSDVVCVALSPDGRTVVTGSKDHAVRLWEAATGRALRLLEGHRGTVNGVAFSPDGKVVASASEDRTIRLWSTGTGKSLRVLRGHESGVRGLAFAPEGKVLASAGGYLDNTVRLWDVATGKEARQFKGHRTGVQAVAFSPDGSVLASAGGMLLLVPDRGSDNSVHLWDVATGRELRKFGGPDEDHGISALAFSRDGKMVASGCRGGPIRLWEAATGRQRLELKGTRGDGALAFSPSGAVLVAVTPNGSSEVSFYDVGTGRERGRLRGHQSGVYSVAFSADGRRLVSGSEDTTALLWDVTALVRPVRPAEARLSPEQLRAHWADLAGADAARAYRSAGALASAPAQAVPWLRERLRPVKASVDARRLARLIGELDSDQFAVRGTALRELEGLGDLAEPALRRALAGRPSLETQRRLEGLLDKLQRQAPPPAALQALRALEVLERAGTPAARALLAELAKGAREARLTREARASLERLGPR
jgi:RNA polymerase sigma factor (sigma-70 family)